MRLAAAILIVMLAGAAFARNPITGPIGGASGVWPEGPRNGVTGGIGGSGGKGGGGGGGGCNGVLDLSTGCVLDIGP